MKYAYVTWQAAQTLLISKPLHQPIKTQTVQISTSFVMSDQGVTSPDAEGSVGEAPNAKTPLRPLLAKDSTSVEKPRPSQGIFTTPQNDSFYKLYTYSDLDSTEQDIRLIHVFKDEHCDLIQCQFLPQSSLQEASGSYHTISYCAGDPSKAKPILLQGIKFNVFANLHHALENTLSAWKSSHIGGKCILWVDQICINQRSDAERSHQVGFMRDIYTNSQATFTSLSTADDDDTAPNVMDWLKEIDEAYQSNLQASKKEFSPRNHAFKILIESSKFKEGLASFHRLVQAPWWRRAWIHQEFICSPSVIFMYHDSTISFAPDSFLLLLCRVLRNNLALLLPRGMMGAQESEEAVRCMRAIDLLLSTKEGWRGGEDLKLVLVRSQHCKSSDPRDRIFAFLGLTHPGYGIEIDYRKSNTLDATILHTAKKILEFDRHLDILEYAMRMAKRRTSTLPSWVPDWASDGFLSYRYVPPLPGEEKQLQHDAIGSSVVQTSASDTNAILRVRGLHIDTLEDRYAPWVRWNPNIGHKTVQGYDLRCGELAQKGDELWMIMGSKWPFILRPCDGGYMVVSKAANGTELEDRKVDFDGILSRMRDGLERLRIIDLC